LSFVDNTSDLNKPISSSTQSALNLKQDALTLKTINSLSILGAGNIDISGTPASAVPLVSSGSGVTGTSSKFAREDHKHPITPISSDLTNLLSYGTDGLYRMLPEIYLSNGPITGSAASNYKIGFDTLNQTLYYENSGSWAQAPISVDISFTVSDHSASLPGVLPLSAPVTPSVGDVHLEIYSTNLIYWIRGATSWVQGPVLLTNPNGAVTVSPASTNTVGSVGISNLYARQDHKHPAQGISSDNLNEITVGSDGLHYFKAKTYVYEYADLGTLQATPSQYKRYGVIYITTDTDTIYRWDGTNFKQLTKNIIDGGGA
jgi:hypothetical protein